MSYLRMIVAWNNGVDLRQYLPLELEVCEIASQQKTERVSLQIDYSPKLGIRGIKKACG